jgi:MoxR-like ATPase
LQDLSPRVSAEMGKVVVGREREAELLLISFLAKGHVLLEGVPGVSKTMMAKAFTRCLGLDFKRVQFTPDMLPLDIIGGFVFNVKSREFDFRKGPIFTNILLADEINRAPPKVQSALLEGMQERQVTVEGRTELLPHPFMVVATQNPLEFQGVYPLPEGQLDRFMMKVIFDYQDEAVERKVIERNLLEMNIDVVGQVATEEELAKVFAAVDAVKVSNDLLEYLAGIAHSSRTDERVSLGASPRAVVHLAQCSRARAYVDGRDYVTPDDIKDLAIPVLAHRIRLDQSAILKGSTEDVNAVVSEFVERVVPPR